MTSNPNSRLRHPLTRLLPLLLIALAALILPSVAQAQATTPTVSSVAITSSPGMDNTYATGDTITVSLTFSEAVTVTGTPYVVVDIGGQPRNFKYSGDGASAAAQPFSYTALVGDRDLDGVSLQVNSLTLNGGTIQATDDSTSATLANSAMTFANHKVETQVTLLSSLTEFDTPDTVTISATQSATVRIQVGDARDQYDINAITLDVKTPSNSLDVTVKLVSSSDAFADYTYTGSVTAAGLRTFTLGEQSVVKFGNVGFPPGEVAGGVGPTYEIEISGSGAGSIQLAGTDDHVSNPGVVSRLIFPPLTGGIARAKVRVSGHKGTIPNLIYGDVVSSPPNGSAYAAGDRVDMLFVFTRPVDYPGGLTLPFWLGNGADHRREARLVTEVFDDFVYVFFSYTVQPGDTDADGIYIGADPLGDNAGIDFHAEDTPAFPAYVRLAANQLAASQSVDGSGSRTCQEVLCSTVRSGVAPGDRFSGFSIYNRVSKYPFLTSGASSAWSFEYGGEEDAVVELVLDQEDDALELALLDGLPGSLHARLALSVDGTVFLLSEADFISFSGRYFDWYDPGLTWAEGDEIDVKLIETGTATFDAASYTKTEGDSFDVTVTLGDSFVSTLTLPIVVAGNGGADATDYTGIPENLVFAPGETVKTFTITIVDDIRDEEGESLTLSFDDPHIKSGGTNETATVTITDNDPPEVDFGASSYTVAEGGMQMVTVTLTSAPGSAVTIPITTTDQGSTTPADYSGVPANVMFSTGQTYAFFTFRATQDTEDDDDESVKLTFGTLPSGVQAGTTTEVTFDITDDDDPQVTVSFGAGAYTVPEGGTQAVTVRLSADPERTVVIPLTATDQGTTSPTDYSVPLSVTFNDGETEKTVTFTAAQDTDDDDDESVLLGFGTSLPARVSASGTVVEHGEHHRRRRPAGDGVVRGGRLHGAGGRDAGGDGQAERGPGAHGGHPPHGDGPGHHVSHGLLRAVERDVQRWGD